MYAKPIAKPLSEIASTKISGITTSFECDAVAFCKSPVNSVSEPSVSIDAKLADIPTPISALADVDIMKNSVLKIAISFFINLP